MKQGTYILLALCCLVSLTVQNETISFKQDPNVVFPCLKDAEGALDEACPVATDCRAQINSCKNSGEFSRSASCTYIQSTIIETPTSLESIPTKQQLSDSITKKYQPNTEATQQKIDDYVNTYQSLVENLSIFNFNGLVDHFKKKDAIITEVKKDSIVNPEFSQHKKTCQELCLSQFTDAVATAGYQANIQCLIVVQAPPTDGGNTDTNTGNTDTNTGNTDTDTGNTDTNSGNTDTNTGNTDTDTGNTDTGNTGSGNTDEGNVDNDGNTGGNVEEPSSSVNFNTNPTEVFPCLKQKKDDLDGNCESACSSQISACKSSNEYTNSESCQYIKSTEIELPSISNPVFPSKDVLKQSVLKQYTPQNDATQKILDDYINEYGTYVESNNIMAIVGHVQKLDSIVDQVKAGSQVNGLFSQSKKACQELCIAQFTDAQAIAGYQANLSCLYQASTDSGSDGQTGGGDDTNTGGSDNTSGGNDNTTGGDDTSNGGTGNTDGGNDNTSGGDDTTNGGDDTTNGGDDTTNGGDDTTSGGNDNSNGGSDIDIDFDYEKDAQKVFFCLYSTKQKLDLTCNDESECKQQVRECKASTEYANNASCQYVDSTQSFIPTIAKPVPTADDIKNALDKQLDPKSEVTQKIIDDYIAEYKALLQAWQGSNILDTNSDEAVALKAHLDKKDTIITLASADSDIDADFARHMKACQQVCLSQFTNDDAKENLKESIECLKAAVTTDPNTDGTGDDDLVETPNDNNNTIPELIDEVIDDKTTGVEILSFRQFIIVLLGLVLFMN